MTGKFNVSDIRVLSAAADTSAASEKYEPSSREGSGPARPPSLAAALLARVTDGRTIGCERKTHARAVRIPGSSSPERLADFAQMAARTHDSGKGKSAGLIRARKGERAALTPHRKGERAALTR
jgi:hypothetical protein